MAFSMTRLKALLLSRSVLSAAMWTALLGLTVVAFNLVKHAN